MKEDIVFSSAENIEKKIAAGSVSSKFVLDAIIEKIKAANEKTNAIVTMDIEDASKQAVRADEMLKCGEVKGPLHGIPITVKDFLETANMRSTASHKPMSNHIPDKDATVVARMRDSGAIILGKTNMPEMAADCQTNSPIFGRTNNPWDLTRTPGGSSGGGAAAVASGMSFMDIGNDLMGSIRIPASFCGVYSLAPTAKLVPNTGTLLQTPLSGTIGSFLRPGIIARSVEDLEIGLSVIAGYDENETDTLPVCIHREAAENSSSIRVCYTEDAGGLPVSRDVRDCLKNFVDKLSNRGYSVSPIRYEDFDFKLSREVFLRIFNSITTASLPPFIRFAARYFGRAKCFDMDLKKYLEAEYKRNELIKQAESLMSRFDILLCPVTATPAFKHMAPDSYAGFTPVYKKGIMVDGREVNYAEANLGFTIPFTVTGSPVVTMPIGYSNEGLPIGVQAVGRRWGDYRLLKMASAISKIIGPMSYPDL